MFITRATRHDKADLKELLDEHGWTDVNLDEGTAFIARDGTIAGCVRIVEVAPQTLMVDDVLVREDKRQQGTGRALMQAAMNARGGSMYLVCHADRIRFYEHLSFKQLPPEEIPEAALEYMRKVGDHPQPPDHPQHFYMKAR